MGSIKRTCLKITIRAAMFLVYLFIGAGLFILLESSYQSQLDEQARTTLENSKNKMRIKNVTEEELLELEKAIEEALDIGVIGSRTFLKNWDFANSFFFCGNVITTIGKCLISSQWWSVAFNEIVFQKPLHRKCYLINYINYKHLLLTQCQKREVYSSVISRVSCKQLVPFL